MTTLPVLDALRWLDSAAVVVVQLDMTGCVRWVNKVFEQLLSWRRDDALGRDWCSTFLSVNAEQRAWHPSEALLAATGTCAILAPVLTRDGGVVCLEWHNSVVRDDDGHALGVLAVGVDTELARDGCMARELELQRSQIRLADAQRVAKIGSWELDVTNNELVWSDEIYRIFEIDPTRFGASYDAFLDAVHPDDRQAVDRAYRSSLRDRQSYEIIHRLQMADGQIKWVHERCETTFDTDGTAIRSLGTVQDVTSRVLAEQAAALNTAAIESSGDAIAFSDLEGQITYVNPAFIKLWGYHSPADVLGRRVSELCEDSHTSVSVLGAPGIDEGWSGEVKARHADGTVRLMQVSVHLVVDASGCAAALMTWFTDLSRRIETERQLAAQLREKEVLLREIHHRVKNNLQIVSSLLHFEARKTPPRSALRAFTELRERLLAMTLVHEKLYQSNNLSLVDFPDYVRTLVQALSASQRRVAIHFEATSETVTLPIETALPAGMIVCELITNILKYAFPDGHAGAAIVSTHADVGRVILTVADDGVGFPDEFEFAAGRTSGLQLVRALVSQLGGEVAIKNRGGAHVVVSFPKSDPHAHATGTCGES